MRVLLAVFANLLRSLLWPVWLAARAATRPRGRWLYVRLEKHLTELHRSEPVWRRARALRDRNVVGSLEELRELTKLVLADPKLDGVCVSIAPLSLGWASCESARELLLQLRGGGKRLVCYLVEGGSNRELYLASAAERLIMTPWSTLGPLGFAAHPLYFKRLLERVGVQVEVEATGQYKSAAEPLLLSAMSEPAREQSQALIDGQQHALVAALRERGLSGESVAALFAKGLIGAEAARELGLVDELRYDDELYACLVPAEASDSVPATAWVSARTYLTHHRLRLLRPLRPPPYVAVVKVSGTISQDRRAMGRAADRASIVTSLRKAGRDARARAVVLYVNSPGGSAFASELIHREVQRLARKKPVIAYFGDVAASGGYYIASACHAIVARPLTITGSIGVISARFSALPLLDRLGIHADVLRSAPHADMMNGLRALDPEERAILQAHVAELYGRFLQVVAEGRGREVSDIEPLAKGRVWSGLAAQERGLVDALGGIEVALEHARDRLGELAESERAALRLVVCSGRPDPSQLPPHAAGAPLAELLGELAQSRLDNLAFLVRSRNEPALLFALDAAHVS